MPSVLLTGFEPFGGETTNPSWTTVQAVRDAWNAGSAGSDFDSSSGSGRVTTIHARELPVAFDVVGDALLAAIEDTTPDIVICVGQAGGTAEIHVERVAINVDDARIPDNTGFQPIDEPIVAGGPAAYFSSLPIKAAVAAISDLGIPAIVSQTAGTYTCNHVFYLLMHELESRSAVRGGFVHVPFGPNQVVGTDRPSLPIESMVAAITAVITASLATTVDAKIGGGTLN